LTAARRLAVPEAILQRRLRETGISFVQLRDAVRRGLALEAINDPSISIATLASRCGFADAAAFVRAFRRWTGDSPGAYRQKRAHAARVAR
jgi:AraC-like DNA-binding protein